MRTKAWIQMVIKQKEDLINLYTKEIRLIEDKIPVLQKELEEYRADLEILNK